MSTKTLPHKIFTLQLDDQRKAYTPGEGAIRSSRSSQSALLSPFGNDTYLHLAPGQLRPWNQPLTRPVDPNTCPSQCAGVGVKDSGLITDTYWGQIAGALNPTPAKIEVLADSGDLISPVQLNVDCTEVRIGPNVLQPTIRADHLWPLQKMYCR